MAINVNPVRGTRDYLPREMRIRDAMQAIILRTYENNGFQRIQTPIMEEIERLDKSDGGENLNMIFRILKRGQKLNLEQENLTEKDLADMGLRFDLTLPLSRYFANNKSELRMPFKVIQIGEVFRAERPQKGRLREFYQCDIDIIGEESCAAEQELIHTTAKALQALGFDEFTVRINDRRILFDLIETAGFPKEDVLSVCITFDKLDKIGADGVRKELEEKGFDAAVIDAFMDVVGNDAITLNEIADYCRDGQGARELAELLQSVQELAGDRYRVEYDKSLVRGMGYYTGTIFEIVSPKFKSSIAGGGRYDKMIGKWIGEDYPAVGFSIGFERICEILLNSEELRFDVGQKRMGLFYDAETPMNDVIRRADEFRAEGYDVTTIRRGKKLGKQIAALEKEGFDAAYIYGDEAIKELK